MKHLCLADAVRRAATMVRAAVAHTTCAAMAFAFLSPMTRAQDTPGSLSPMQACVLFAEDTFAVVNSQANAKARQCECVKDKLGGSLPSTMAAWEASGPGSPGLHLVECARPDIVRFYADAASGFAKERLREKGLTDGQIGSFGECVGEGAYAEMRRTAASPKEQAGSLDKTRFRQMYASCEAASH